MSNQLDSSEFDERDHFLRQTFAWRVEQPEHLAALVELGDILQSWIYETNQFGPDRKVEMPEIEILSAGKDLLLVAAYLREKADERFHHSLQSESKTRLCERAERWAEQVYAIGQAIVEDVRALDEDSDDETREDSE